MTARKQRQPPHRAELVAAFGEGAELIAGDAHDAPVGGHLGAHPVIKVDGVLVPVEYVPLEAGAAFDDGDAGNLGEEGFADAFAAKGWVDEEVFEVDAVMALPGGVVVEVEGEAGGLSEPVGEEDVEAGDGAEAVAVEVGGGGEDGFGLTLVDGELVNEAKDGGDVASGGEADLEGRSGHGGASVAG